MKTSSPGITSLKDIVLFLLTLCHRVMTKVAVSVTPVNAQSRF
jgi:hypothetical protein